MRPRRYVPIPEWRIIRASRIISALECIFNGTIDLLQGNILKAILPFERTNFFFAGRARNGMRDKTKPRGQRGPLSEIIGPAEHRYKFASAKRRQMGRPGIVSNQ